MDVLEEYFNSLWAKKEQAMNKENSERDRKIADCVNKYTHLATELKKLTTKQKDKAPKPENKKPVLFENDDYDDGLSRLISSRYNKNSRKQSGDKDNDDENDDDDGIEIVTSKSQKKTGKKNKK